MSDLVPFTEAVAPDRRRFARLVRPALRWCSVRGQPADANLFALVCAAAVGSADEFPGLWTRVGMRRLLWAGFSGWCAERRCAGWPVEVVPAVWVWFNFLHATGRLDPAGDPLWELRKPLICSGGLGFDGRPRRAGDPSPIPCECYLPYRGSVQYLNDRLATGQLRPDDLARDRVDPPISTLDPATLGPRWTNDRAPDSRRARRRPASKPGSRPGDGGRSGSRPG